MQMSTEQKVGLFFIVGLVLLAIVIELVQSWNPFRTEYPYHTHFVSTVGLKVGDPVRLAGVEVGKINVIALDGVQVRVDFTVYDGTNLLTGSVATIRQLNLLGGQYLGLEFGPPDALPLPPDSEVRSVESTNIDELITRLDKNQQVLFDKFTSIVDKVNNGQGLIGKLVNDDSLYGELQKTITSLAKITGVLEKSGAADNLSGTLANLQAITKRINNGEGTLGQLVNDDQVYASLKTSLANLESITQKANAEDSLLSKLLTDTTFYDDLKQTVANLQKITERIERGDGALGKMINDPDLYYDAKTTLNKLEKAADGMSNTSTISALGVVAGQLF